MKETSGYCLDRASNPMVMRVIKDIQVIKVFEHC